MKNKENEYYRTRDLAEAAMLIVCEQKLLNIEREGSTCWFIFSNKKVCEQLSSKYFFSEVLVNARDFHEICSRLKGRVFAKD